MRRGRVVVVTLVLLSAGCLGFEFGGPDSNQSATTTPPGLGDGVTNASALVAAHERSLVGVDVVIETTESQWDTLGGTNQTITTRVRTDGNGTMWQRQTTDTTDSRFRIEQWTNESGTFHYFNNTGEIESITGPVTATERYRTAVLERWLATGQYEIAVVDGEPTRYILSTTTYTAPDDEPLEADTVRYEAHAVITETGRVTAMSATLVTVETNRWGRHIQSRSFTYRVARTGRVNLSEPDWLTASPRQEVADE